MAIDGNHRHQRIRPRAPAVRAMTYKNSTNSRVKRTCNAETQVVVLKALGVPSAAGRAETLGNISRGPAADDTVSATAACSPRRAVRWRSIVSVVIAIL